MAVTAADRDLLVTMLMEAFGEDYQAFGRVLARLEVRFPAVTWRARLVALAPSFAPYLSSGLSINWFTTEVGRQADAIKAQ